jgi:hypothetical protein
LEIKPIIVVSLNFSNDHEGLFQDLEFEERIVSKADSRQEYFDRSDGLGVSFDFGLGMEALTVFERSC